MGDQGDAGRTHRKDPTLVGTVRLYRWSAVSGHGSALRRTEGTDRVRYDRQGETTPIASGRTDQPARHGIHRRSGALFEQFQGWCSDDQPRHASDLSVCPRNLHLRQQKGYQIPWRYHGFQASHEEGEQQKANAAHERLDKNKTTTWSFVCVGGC